MLNAFSEPTVALAESTEKNKGKKKENPDYQEILVIAADNSDLEQAQ